MTIKERESILKINDLLVKATKPLQSTFSPQTGRVEEIPPPQPATLPLPLTIPPQPEG